jgi:hypothetical protein
VLQEYVFENPTICEREVGCSPVNRDVEFVFSSSVDATFTWMKRSHYS